VALYDEAAGKIDVQGWITLTNSSGTAYDNAQTLLVAGSPSQAGSPANSAQSPTDGVHRFGARRSAGGYRAAARAARDFYLYPLPERTTIANLQTKQVGFLDVHGVPAEHGYGI